MRHGATRRSRVSPVGLLLIVILSSLGMAAPARATGLQDRRPVDDEALRPEKQSPSTGEIFGRVVEFDGTPVPGVTVVLRGSDPPGDRRTTVTDADATFRFAGLPPGAYLLLVTLPGVEAEASQSVEVEAGVRIQTTLELSLFATEVEVVVRAEDDLAGRPHEREATSGRQTVEFETLDQLPLPAEQALEVLPILPGVVRDPKGRLSIDGTWPKDSILLFNGIDLVDPFSGQFRLRIPLEAVDRVELYDGVYPAIYGQVIGGVVEVGSAPAGERWKFDVSSLFPTPRWKDGTIQGLRSLAPRVRVSGPLGKGVYLSQAAEAHFNRFTVWDIPGDPAQETFTEEGWDSVTQIDWRPNSRHASRLVLLAYPQSDEFVGLDGLTPPEATRNVEREARAILGSHQWRIDDRRLFEVIAQYNSVGIDSAPRGPQPLEVIPEGVRGNAFHSEDRDTQHLQVRVTYNHLFRTPGDPRSHLVQIGGELHKMEFDGRFDNDTVFVRGSDGRLLQRIDFVGSGPIHGDKLEWAAFVQDRWWHSERFWCDLGLRVAGDSVTDGVRLSPRVGVAWDPLGDRRLLLKAATGILYRRTYLGELLWERLPTRIETTFSEGGPAGRLQILSPRREEELSAPLSILATVEVSHRIDPDLLVRARYYRREGRGQIFIDRVAAPGILAVGRGDPLDGPLAGFDPASPRPARAVGTMSLTDDGSSTAWGLELTAWKRFSERTELYLSYVWSSTEGDLNDFAIVAGEDPDPVLRPNRRAPLPFDSPHRFLVWGTLQTPLWEIVVSPVIEWRTGFPYSVVAEDQSYVGQPNGERFPDFFSLDAQVFRDFRFWDYDVRLGLRFTNLTGHDNPRQVISNVASPRFGEFRNSVPLKISGKFSFSW